MKIGDSGEAFFVFETEEDVPEDLLTSPIAKAVPDKDANEEEALPEDDDLELGAAEVSLDSDADLSSKLEETRLDDNAEEAETAPAQSGLKRAAGFVQSAATEIAPVAALPVAAASLVKDTIQETISGHETQHSTENSRHGSTADLMLDMSGYKIKEEDQFKARETESRLLNRELGAEDQATLADDLVVLTQALLRSADLHKSRTGAGHLEELTAKRPQDSSNLSPQPSPSLQQQASFPRASSPAPSMLETANTVSPIRPGMANSPHLLALTVDGDEHIFELALCALNESDATIDATTFQERRITFADFLERPNLATDRNLVMRYKQRHLTWDSASPVLAALSIYQNAASQSRNPAEDSSQPRTRTTSEQSGDGKASAGRGWSKWWGRSRSHTGPAPPSTVGPASPSLGTSARSRSPSPTRSGSSNDGKHPSDTTEPSSVSEGATASQKDGPATTTGKHYAKTLRLTSEQLKNLNLNYGMNEVSFSVPSSYSSNTIKCTSRIFLWESNHKICISDIDGTITKSDALGHVFTMIGRDWTHLGVAKLYTDIAKNGYKMMYLTSRAIGQADTTREYLKGIVQNGYTLPEGPVIMSPDRLMTSLHREVIMRKPEVFKMGCLQDIQRLFAARPFFAGFGNRITDALSYRSVDIPSSRIFTIDSTGDIRLELLELAGYKSSYIAMNDLVDQMFPPVNRTATPEFTDFNYWRAPLAQIELPDLTPSLAATESSRYSLRRLGSNITQTISRRSSKSELVGDPARSRASSPRPTSPLAHPDMAVSEEPEDLELGLAVAAAPNSQKRADSSPNSQDSSSPMHTRMNSMAEAAVLSRKMKYGADIEAQRGADDNEDSLSIDDLDEDDFPNEEMDFSSVPF